MHDCRTSTQQAFITTQLQKGTSCPWSSCVGKLCKASPCLRGKHWKGPHQPGPHCEATDTHPLGTHCPKAVSTLLDRQEPGKALPFAWPLTEGWMLVETIVFRECNQVPLLFVHCLLLLRGSSKGWTLSFVEWGDQLSCILPYQQLDCWTQLPWSRMSVWLSGKGSRFLIGGTEMWLEAPALSRPSAGVPAKVSRISDFFHLKNMRAVFLSWGIPWEFVNLDIIFNRRIKKWIIWSFLVCFDHGEISCFDRDWMIISMMQKCFTSTFSFDYIFCWL